MMTGKELYELWCDGTDNKTAPWDDLSSDVREMWDYLSIQVEVGGKET